MASQKLYEPASRSSHCQASSSGEGRVYAWGGLILEFESGSKDDRIKLAGHIEQFDPYLEIWSQLNTGGTPHPGLFDAACTSFGDCLYMYGGVTLKKYKGCLSYLNMKTLTWSLLCGPEACGGPMIKQGCGMVHFKEGKLAVIGGYGYPSGSIQPGSSFMRDPKFKDWTRGWSNEFHVFDISQGSHSQVH